MQVEHITTTAFHPQANGMVEHLHRQIKDVLHARGAAAWVDHLPWVILGLCAAPKDDSRVSATEATLGQSLMIPGQPKTPEGAIPAALHAPLAVIPPTRHSYAKVLASPSPSLDTAEWVYMQERADGDSPCRQLLGPLSSAVPQGSAQASKGSSRSTSSCPAWSWAPSGCSSW